VTWWDRYVWRRTQDRQQLTLEQLLAEDARPVAAGVAVTTATAMQHSAVWACVNLIAGAISTLPLAAYRDGDRDPLPTLPPILRAPSAGWLLPDFLFATLQSLLVEGNAYGLIVARAGAGLLPAQVELLAAHRVSVTVPNGAIEYRVDGREVDPADLWHVRAFTTPGNVLGLSPIGHAKQAVGLGLAAEQYAAKLFGESAIPSGLLTTDQHIRRPEAQDLKEQWRNAHQGRRDIAVLGSGARFQAITIPPEEAQFLETTRANVATIARYFGVQPELIGGESGGSLTYANVEQRALDFLQFCLRPWIVRTELALSALLSSTTNVRFNAAGLVRTDLLTRYQAHESAIRAGWKLRSEVRELEDLPPVAGIDDQPPTTPGAVA
jgi:HK97 family phage portal protein